MLKRQGRGKSSFRQRGKEHKLLSSLKKKAAAKSKDKKAQTLDYRSRPLKEEGAERTKKEGVQVSENGSSRSRGGRVILWGEAKKITGNGKKFPVNASDAIRRIEGGGAGGEKRADNERRGLTWKWMEASGALNPGQDN